MDAVENLRTALLGAGMVVVDVTAQKRDALGMRNTSRLSNSVLRSLKSPPEGEIDDDVAAGLIGAMGPTTGAESVPRRLREAATRDYGMERSGAPPPLSLGF